MTIDQDLEISNQDKKYVYELMLGSVVILLYGTTIHIRMHMHTDTQSALWFGLHRPQENQVKGKIILFHAPLP